MRLYFSKNSKLFSTLICLSLFSTFSFILLLISTTYSYLNDYQQQQSMRICLPFSLNRISSTVHQKLSCQSLNYNLNQSKPFTSTSYNSDLNNIMSEIESTSTTQPQSNGIAQKEGELAEFLKNQKQLFLNDLKNDNADGWTIVMGNEAGDLDSIASSISYSYLSTVIGSKTVNKKSIPLILTPFNLMKLRPENILALNLASITDLKNTLLYPEEIPISTLDLFNKKGIKFSLVDHNKLLPQFGVNDNSVESIIDHHEDENQHLEKSVNPRLIINPIGSCSSLVTKYFKPFWEEFSTSKEANIPKEISTLLLSSILIDTSGLKPDRKATKIDYESASFLYPKSSLYNNDNSTSLVNGNAENNANENENSIIEFSQDGSNIPKDLIDLNNYLQNTKNDVSNLNTSELLLRDYKEYILSTSSLKFPSLKIGLSTVPLSLKKWLSSQSQNDFKIFKDQIDIYMNEKNLDLQGILTSFNNSQNKHKREFILIVRKSKQGAIQSQIEAQRILLELKNGLEDNTKYNEILNLQKWDKDNKGSVSSWEVFDKEMQVWKQGNAKSTRKQVAPILRDLIAQLQ
ncbi:uncharacterized protein L201_007840 [Kwoniella dendrophila CBS 6074]|uniref:DHHA2 domain-containing protein n=1 Tax=Kwoniella dendrophila CBS 6074 TaxID=1295534 RepID=A0AAX4K7U7_9TREE